MTIDYKAKYLKYKKKYIDLKNLHGGTNKKKEIRTDIQSVLNNDPEKTDVYWYMKGVTNAEVRLLAEALKNNTHVDRINLSNNSKITDENMALLTEVVEKSNIIVNIGLHATSVSDAKKLLIYAELVKNTVKQLDDDNLEFVSWFMMEIDDAQIRQLLPGLTKSIMLEKLLLTFNSKITDAIIPELLKAVKSSYVYTVDLDDTGVTASNIDKMRNILQINKVLFDVKNNNPEMIQVDWKNKNVGNFDVLRLAKAMQNNTNLQTIDLYNNREITDEIMPELIGAVQNSKVVSIWFNNITIEDDKKQEINNALAYNARQRIRDNDRALKSLNWANMNITDEQVIVLAEGIKNGRRIKNINLTSNKGITDASMPALLDAVQNSKVVYIHLYDTGVTKAKQEKMTAIVFSRQDKKR